MLDLHEQLSEFSYGYGVTREMERRLRKKGLRAVPYFPNLRAEKKLGADVGFRKPGGVLMMQFKLGQQMERFRAQPHVRGMPGKLNRPFWRFAVNVTEPEGQFQTLLAAEDSGARVFYAAPRFATWTDYTSAFDRQALLKKSAWALPHQIHSAASANPSVNGWHHVVYDNSNCYVCSEPTQIDLVEADDVVEKLVAYANDGVPLRSRVKSIFDRIFEPPESTDVPANVHQNLRFRRTRLSLFMEDSLTEVEAQAKLIASDAFTQGIQTVFLEQL